MKIYLIRHGQTDWNIQRKIQGSHDIPLNETGRRQAKKLAQGMDSRPVSRIFSSTLTRARETAECISSRQGVEIYFMPQLIEVEFGEWEGLTWEEIDTRFPKEHKLWRENPAQVAPPGGETQAQIKKRCAETVHEIIKRTNGKEDAAVVSHGATLANMITYMLRNDTKEGIIVSNSSITTIDYNPVSKVFTLLHSNDITHLEDEV
jgi:broad specificity phosphatase PhoE